MELTKEQMQKRKAEEMQAGPVVNFLMGLFGTALGDLMHEEEKGKESHTKVVEPKIKEAPTNEEDEMGKRIKTFFDKMVEDGKATATVEDGHPHYSIKMDDEYTEPESAENLVEENSSFSMSKEELAEFVRDYMKLESTFKKLEYAYGIDLNASADSIYTQYNALVWNLIGKVFGEDNRDDIADYCFGNSNFDTVEDLYEELV